MRERVRGACRRSAARLGAAGDCCTIVVSHALFPDQVQEFKSGKSPLMIATDVASRGLDVKEIKYVINYDMPKEIEDYVHRIGRTGRKTAEGYNEGTAISFFTAANARLAPPLVAILTEAGQVVPPELAQFSSYGGGGRSRYSGGGGRGGFGGGRGGYGGGGQSGSNAMPLGGGRRF